jgi:hypothetical protein
MLDPTYIVDLADDSTVAAGIEINASRIAAELVRGPQQPDDGLPSDHPGAKRHYTVRSYEDFLVAEDDIKAVTPIGALLDTPTSVHSAAECRSDEQYLGNTLHIELDEDAVAEHTECPACHRTYTLYYSLRGVWDKSENEYLDLLPGQIEDMNWDRGGAYQGEQTFNIPHHEDDSIEKVYQLRRIDDTLDGGTVGWYSQRTSADGSTP